jgi:hypothetical protein
MSKKLLKEAQVRRFMGLAGMQANIVSNTITEMYGQEEKEEVEESLEAVTEEEVAEYGAMPEEEDEAMEPVEDEPAASEADAEISPEAVQNLRDAFEQVVAPLEAAVGGAGEEAMPEPEGGEMDLEPVADEPAEEEPAGEEEAEEDVFEGVELQLSEEEIVQEVSRRVAKRILEAKKAHKKMNKALGK